MFAQLKGLVSYTTLAVFHLTLLHCIYPAEQVALTLLASYTHGEQLSSASLHLKLSGITLGPKSISYPNTCPNSHQVSRAKHAERRTGWRGSFLNAKVVCNGYVELVSSHTDSERVLMSSDGYARTRAPIPSLSGS